MVDNPISLFLCRVLAAVPATGCDTLGQRSERSGFYAAFSRRSLRPDWVGIPYRWPEEFLCRVLAAVPATLFPALLALLRAGFLCRVLAAVPATRAEDRPENWGKSFYAAFSRRSLRRSRIRDDRIPARTFLCRVLAAVPATVVHQIRVAEGAVSMPRSRGGPCDIERGASDRLGNKSFYAAFSRRSLRRRRKSQWENM